MRTLSNIFIKEVQRISVMVQTELVARNIDIYILNQLLKFSIIGILNTIVGYVLFIFFLKWFNYIFALAISYLITIIHSYLWNKFWTFESKKSPIKEFLRFISVYFVVFGANALTLFILIDTFNFQAWLAQLLSLSIITIISFCGHRYWSFR